MRLVLDASAAAHVVLRTETAPALIEKLDQANLVIAPTLFHSEMANTLWKYVNFGELDYESALERYEEAVGLVDSFEPDDGLITEALAASARYRHPIYDMLYVVLARRYGCKVITADKKLRRVIEAMDEAIIGLEI